MKNENYYEKIISTFKRGVEQESKGKGTSRELVLTDFFLKAQQMKKEFLESCLERFSLDETLSHLEILYKQPDKRQEEYGVSLYLIDQVLQEKNAELPELDFSEEAFEEWLGENKKPTLRSLVNSMSYYVKNRIYLVDRKYLFPVKDLSIHARAYNCLKDEGIRYGYQLLFHAEAFDALLKDDRRKAAYLNGVHFMQYELGKLKNMSLGTFKELEKAMEDAHISWESDLPDQNTAKQITKSMNWLNAVTQLLDQPEHFIEKTEEIKR